jgi:hypothetical protein
MHKQAMMPNACLMQLCMLSPRCTLLLPADVQTTVTAKGCAVILSPYFTDFNARGGDESDEIATILTTAGYTVTLKCDNPTVCPTGAPTLEDFKGWGQHAAAVLVSHGDASADGSNNVVFTRVPYTATFYADWLAGRIEVMGDGTIALTPAWFNLYNNQLQGTIAYFSVCR